MNLFIAAGFLFTSVYIAISNAQSPITLHSYVNENDGSGNYYFKYNCSDGQIREERGILQDGGGEIGEDGSKAWIKVTGLYSFVGTDGKTYKVTYEADKGGYRPKVMILGDGTQNDVGSLSSNRENSFGFDPATGFSTGSSSGSSITGLSVESNSSSSSSSVSSGSVSSTSSSTATTQEEDEPYHYQPPQGDRFNGLHSGQENTVSEHNREYIPPTVPESMYVPAPSVINSIMAHGDLPYVLARIMENGDNEIAQNNLF